MITFALKSRLSDRVYVYKQITRPGLVNRVLATLIESIIHEYTNCSDMGKR